MNWLAGIDKVVVQEYKISKPGQQIALHFSPPQGIEEVCGLLAYADMNQGIWNANSLTDWREMSAGRLWLHWNKSPSFFHFQSVDLPWEFDGNFNPVDICEPMGLDPANFAHSGGRFEAMPVCIGPDQPIISGFYADIIQQRLGVTDNYTLFLNWYYKLKP